MANLVRSLSCLLVLCLLGSLPAAQARTWDVSPDGATGDGDLATVVAQATDGDTLLLAAGEHPWQSTDSIRTSLTCIGAEGATISIGFVWAIGDTEFFAASGVTFRGATNFRSVAQIRLDRCVFTGSILAASIGLSEELYMTNCTVEGNGNVDRREAVGVIVGHGTAEFVDCIFRNNVSSAGLPFGKAGDGGGAVSIRQDASAVVRGCVFEDNSANSGGAFHFDGRDLVFEQNTIVRNNGHTGSVVVRTSGTSALIRNNLFAENGTYGFWLGEDGAFTPQVYCNAYWANDGYPDSNSRDGLQWRASFADGYEGADDYYTVVADPEWCDEARLIVGESSDLAEPPGPCEPMGGARDIGCPNPTLERSWGDLKRLFGR